MHNQDPLVGALVAWLVSVLAVRGAEARRTRRQQPSKYRLRRWAKIVQAADPAEPRTGKELSQLAGLKFDGGFRSDVSELCRQNRIRRVTGTWGYLRCAETGAAPPTAEAPRQGGACPDAGRGGTMGADSEKGELRQ